MEHRRDEAIDPEDKRVLGMKAVREKEVYCCFPFGETAKPKIR